MSPEEWEQYRLEAKYQAITQKILASTFSQLEDKPLPDALAEKIKQLHIPKGSAEKEEIKQAIEKNIYSNRRLKDAEFDYLFACMCKNTDEFVINVDCLDDWCYGNDFFTMVLSRVGAKKIKQINYSNARNLNTCTKNINRTVKITENQLQQKRNLPYFSIEMESGWKLTIFPEDIPILDNNTHIYRYNYILEQSNTSNQNK